MKNGLGYVAVMVIFLVSAATVFGLHADDANPNKVPDSYAVRLLKVQKDQIGLQAEISQLTARYQQDTQTLQHDNDEIQEIKNEAIKAAGRDINTTDVDTDKLEFIPKMKPAPKPETKTDKK